MHVSNHYVPKEYSSFRSGVSSSIFLFHVLNRQKLVHHVMRKIVDWIQDLETKKIVHLII
jgi:hypothetical protein